MLLYERLQRRGYKTQQLLPLFNDIIHKLLHPPSPTTTQHHTTSTTSPHPTSPFKHENIFIHLKYHPNDISRKKLRSIYNDIFNTPDNENESFISGISNPKNDKLTITNTTIAYSRPQNIRDILCPTKLHIPPSENTVQQHINNINNQ